MQNNSRLNDALSLGCDDHIDHNEAKALMIVLWIYRFGALPQYRLVDCLGR